MSAQSVTARHWVRSWLWRVMGMVARDCSNMGTMYFVRNSHTESGLKTSFQGRGMSLADRLVGCQANRVGKTQSSLSPRKRSLQCKQVCIGVVSVRKYHSSTSAFSLVSTSCSSKCCMIQIGIRGRQTSKNATRDWRSLLCHPCTTSLTKDTQHSHTRLW